MTKYTHKMTTRQKATKKRPKVRSNDDRETEN